MAPHPDPGFKGFKVDKSSKIDLPQDCPVRILIYGLMRESTVVGKLLSDTGLYLQHPSATEYDRLVRYNNPHFLIRPGSLMPKLEELPFLSESATSTASDSLDEASKSRFMRIFDLASESGISPQVEPSSRLLSSLKR